MSLYTDSCILRKFRHPTLSTLACYASFCWHDEGSRALIPVFNHPDPLSLTCLHVYCICRDMDINGLYKHSEDQLLNDLNEKLKQKVAIEVAQQVSEKVPQMQAALVREDTIKQVTQKECRCERAKIQHANE